MKRNILIFGFVLGAILCVNMIIMVNLCYTNPGMANNDVVGYVAMVVVFSLVFFGVRNYRNKQCDGLISFAKVFKMGALIAVIGATLYVIVWLFYYYLFVPNYLDHYILQALKNISPAELPTKTKEMENFK